MVHSAPMFALVRAVLNFIIGGALFGVLCASYFAPKFLTWYNSPGGTATAIAQCQCAELTRQVAAELISYQFKGGVAGAGAGLALGIAFVVWRKKRAAKAATAPA